jgi:membrane protein DedA with SNARE-associated domain
VALAFIMLVENLFPPIPSEIVLLYAIGRYGGRPLVLRFRWLLRLSEADLNRADGWFDRYGAMLVFGARMVPIARSVVSLPAGWSGMPVWRFLALTTLGTVIWNLLLIGAGALLGDNYEQVAGWVGTYQKVVLAVVVVGVVAGCLWLWRRRQHRRFPTRTSARR